MKPKKAFKKDKCKVFIRGTKEEGTTEFNPQEGNIPRKPKSEPKSEKIPGRRRAQKNRTPAFNNASVISQVL